MLPVKSLCFHSKEQAWLPSVDDVTQSQFFINNCSLHLAFQSRSYIFYPWIFFIHWNGILVKVRKFWQLAICTSSIPQLVTCINVWCTTPSLASCHVQESEMSHFSDFVDRRLCCLFPRVGQRFISVYQVQVIPKLAAPSNRVSFVLETE